MVEQSLSKVIHRSGLSKDLPNVANSNELLFVEDTMKIYKGAGTDKPLIDFSDVITGFKNIDDLSFKNPAIKGKLYLTDDGVLAYYDGDSYIPVSGTATGGSSSNGDFITSEREGQDTPVGSIISHIGLTAPKHYLVCDGKEYLIKDYPKLTEHFLNDLGSVNYFGGDGVNTFAVPDMRGEFVRGCDQATLRDPDGATRGIGKHQDATYHQATRNKNNMVQINHGQDVTANTWAFSNQDKSEKTTFGKYLNLTGSVITDTSEKMSDYTSRPTNVNVLFCIKCEPTHLIEYHPNYTAFQKDVLFDGNANTIGDYQLSASVESYDLVIVQRDCNTLSPLNIELSSNSTPQPYYVQTSSDLNSNTQGWKAFNSAMTADMDCWHSASGGNQWISIKLDIPRVINRYDVTSRPGVTTTNVLYRIYSMELLGSNDGVLYTPIHTKVFELTWTPKEKRTVEVENKVPYLYYKWNVSAENGYVAVGKLDLFNVLPENAIEESVIMTGTNYMYNDKFNFSIIGNSMKLLTNNTVNRVIGIKGDISIIGSGGVPVPDEEFDGIINDMKGVIS